MLHPLKTAEILVYNTGALAANARSKCLQKVCRNKITLIWAGFLGVRFAVERQNYLFLSKIC